MNTTTPDLIDAKGVVLEPNREKGSALLQRLVQQSNQGKQSEQCWTDDGSNDNLITELEFTEALLELSKHTAPGPDKVKYSDIKNLSADDNRELFTLYEESFTTGQIPVEWSHSFLKPVPKPGRDHSKLNRYPILTTQNTTGKLME